MKRFDFAFVGPYFLDCKSGLQYVEETHNFLKQKGYSSIVITASSEDECVLKEKHIPVMNFYKEAGEYIPSDVSAILKECKTLASRYDFPNMRHIIRAEKYYNGKSEAFLLKRAVAFFRFAEELMETIDFGCFVNDQGAEIMRLALEYVGRKKGIPSFHLGSFPTHFGNRMLIYHDAMHFMDPDFRITPYEEINDDEVEFVKDFINSVRENRTLVNYRAAIVKESDLISRKARKSITHFKSKDYEALLNAVRYNLKTVWKKTVSSQLNRLFVSSRLPERFVFYPLHGVDDSQVTFRNPQFYRQDFLVNVISQSLPEGHRLIVKPHPGLGGLLPLRMLKEIKRISNVLLVNPKMNAHDLIEKSEAVVIINSTVGFEALCHFKPVMVVGNWVLKGYGVTIDVENLSDLPWAIRKALEMRKVDEEKVISLIYSLHKAMYDGSLYIPEPDHRKIAESLIKKGRKHGVIQPQKASI